MMVVIIYLLMIMVHCIPLNKSKSTFTHNIIMVMQFLVTNNMIKVGKNLLVIMLDIIEITP